MEQGSITQGYIDNSVTFDSFKLDPRLLQAISSNGYHFPTLVQSSAIPLALQEKRDIIAKAATGSGKTLSYLIPMIQTILEYKKIKKSTESCSLGIILVPTKELCQQVFSILEKMTLYCSNYIKSLNLSSLLNSGSSNVLDSLLLEKPEIMISTPSTLLNILKNKTSMISLDNLKFLVIDEVDLVLTFGYQSDLMGISEYLPLKKNLQTFLMSATLNDDINELKTKFCRNPAILKLNDEAINADQSKLIQYYMRVNEFDKFLLCYVIFKLNLIKGKSLIFVNNIDRGYRLKLVLEQFGIKSCILNSELPSNSRQHIVEQFNKSVYYLLIATDDTEYIKEDDYEEEPKCESMNDQEEKSHNKNESAKIKAKHHIVKDKEYGVSRGIDFKNVACVLNFDLPTSAKSYVHRIGRTARAGKSGITISFVVPLKEFGKHKPSMCPTAKKDEKILSRIIKQQAKLGFELQPYSFDYKQLEGFRYRMEDGFRAVTQVAVREARIKELKQELLVSEKLKRHFEENPRDLVSLKHDKELHPSRVQQHLKRVPDYLLPDLSRKDTTKIGFVSYHNSKKRGKVNKRKNKRQGKSDSLRNFK